nr:hypothetical protein [Streptomyces indicus]
MELVLEVTDEGALAGAALDRIGEDAYMPDDERVHAESAVQEEAAEALAYLVDPFDLVAEVPGVELAQASWSSESVDHVPDEAWDEDDEDLLDEDGDLAYEEEEPEWEEEEGERGEYGEHGGSGERGEGDQGRERDENHTHPYGAAAVGA